MDKPLLNDDPHVTLTIRLIMQGKVRSFLLKSSLQPKDKGSMCKIFIHTQLRKINIKERGQKHVQKSIENHRDLFLSVHEKPYMFSKLIGSKFT